MRGLQRVRLLLSSDAMAKYFFHAEGADLYADEQGSELPDLHAVQLKAAQTLGELLKEKSAEFWSDGLKVHVANASGLSLISLEVVATLAPALSRK